ncbi:hypothetical protein BDV19DRAFT_70715 [Aspergillus venezuelensis]
MILRGVLLLDTLNAFPNVVKSIETEHHTQPNRLSQAQLCLRPSFAMEKYFVTAWQRPDRNRTPTVVKLVFPQFNLHSARRMANAVEEVAGLHCAVVFKEDKEQAIYMGWNSSAVEIEANAPVLGKPLGKKAAGAA